LKVNNFLHPPYIRYTSSRLPFKRFVGPIDSGGQAFGFVFSIALTISVENNIGIFIFITFETVQAAAYFYQKASKDIASIWRSFYIFSKNL
jgi:hypothetical protein